MLLAALATHAAVPPKAKHVDATQCVSVSPPVTDVWCVTQRGRTVKAAPLAAPHTSSGRAWQHGAPNRRLGCWS